MLVLDPNRVETSLYLRGIRRYLGGGFLDMSLDALVLLGCRIEPDGRPSAAGQRRARALADAFHAGRAPLCVVSGGDRKSVV